MIGEQDLSLTVDLYELAMAQAYQAESMNGTAAFSLFFRTLPRNRNVMLACGQTEVVRLIEGLRFSDDQLRRLATLERFQPWFLDWLARFRFSGTIHALAEGTPVFPQEPILEIEGPIAEAQLLESLVMNYIHLETVMASKALRLKQTAAGRPVIDFGMRRMHGLDAAWRGVRAFRLAGLDGTSHVQAGLDFNMPVRGTMAHSFVQAHDDEMAAFRAYAHLYPGTTLLVDTYDTERAVADLIRWMTACPDVDIGAIRLDSGDLGTDARQCRKALDAAGFRHVRILASGGLDEDRIHRLLSERAPLDGFGVGTALGAASDAPSLELAYKLTEYDGQPRLKNSPGKASYPGRKQVWRESDRQGQYIGDVVTARDESAPGQPLLLPVMVGGERLSDAIVPFESAVAEAHHRIARLPEALRGLAPASYPVAISDRLSDLRQTTLTRVSPPIN
ncbi:nicotinate phosphoribosyltransferase [Tamilnaduibacter salinus]|uniref:Nicotinate phosphoribosyltransferase n=1 Tax=Tamilnaduibacter salinus TaxID=1484056 RepID=A0A2U1CVL7_9GAMM|nr:nicotinate phosphoribosyltransferase [Tamilnaduibacter salinus]PVY75785.1 nicotinate phosphoribosyltransferase [Tamilnaduibacter salinus]